MPQNNGNTVYNDFGIQNYNAGGIPSVGPQLNDRVLSKVVIREARKQAPFSQMSKKVNLPRNHGDTIKRERKFPIIHDQNINTEGVDALGLKLVPGEWYAYDTNGVRTVHATRALAQAVVGLDYISQGNGNLWGSTRDFYLQDGKVNRLREEGGVVNVVGAKRTIISAKIKPYSLSEMFSRQEMELGGEANIKAEKTMELATAYSEVYEMMVRNDLISQGLTNAVFAGGAATMDTVDENCVLDYATLRKFQTALDYLRVPMETKIITGSTNVDTKVVSASRYLFVPLALERTIEEITNGGVNVFTKVAEYANAASGLKDRDMDANFAYGEFGSIGKWRFISNLEMPYFVGAGADATDGIDADGDGIEDVGQALSITDGRYDVFPVLSIGSGAFEVLGLDGTDTRVQYAGPRITPTLDNTGETGVVSVRWYYGMIFNKPEWINMILCSGLSS